LWLDLVSFSPFNHIHHMTTLPVIKVRLRLLFNFFRLDFAAMSAAVTTIFRKNLSIKFHRKNHPRIKLDRKIPPMTKFLFRFLRFWSSGSFGLAETRSCWPPNLWTDRSPTKRFEIFYVLIRLTLKWGWIRVIFNWIIVK
jgi:hypothetical protein